MKSRREACAIPYRNSPLGGLEVLLVTTRGGGWGLPKGGIKKGESARRTASLESLEEAGVLGVIQGEPVGSFSYRKSGTQRRVQVYGLRVERLLERWEEEEQRVRVWVPIQEAPRLLKRRPLARCLTVLRHRLLLEAQPLRVLRWQEEEAAARLQLLQPEAQEAGEQEPASVQRAAPLPRPRAQRKRLPLPCGARGLLRGVCYGRRLRALAGKSVEERSGA